VSDGLRERLAGIYASRGELTPEAVVEEARPADSDLHSRFEWDDSIAGPKYRLQQARELIRSVRVTYAVDNEGREKTVRAFSSIRTPDAPSGRAYRPTDQIVLDPLQRMILLRQCEREWLQFKARYEHLAEFSEIISGSAAATGS
jgi:hypothetical protein